MGRAAGLWLVWPLLLGGLAIRASALFLLV